MSQRAILTTADLVLGDARRSGFYHSGVGQGDNQTAAILRPLLIPAARMGLGTSCHGSEPL